MTDDGAPLGDTLVRQDQVSPSTPSDGNLIERFMSLSGTLTRSTSVPDAAEAIGVASLALTGGQRGAVYLSVAGGKAKRLWISRHGFEDHPNLPEADPAIFPDVRDLPPSHEVRQTAERAGYRSLASWPLMYAGKALGSVVCCFDAPRTWSAAEVDVMSALALQAAAALERALAVERGGVPPAAGVDDARIAEALRILQAESVLLFDAHRELEAQHARLAQGRRELGALNVWLLALQDELRNERSELTKARQELAAEEARVAEARRSVDAQAAAAREEMENQLRNERSELTKARDELASEDARIAEARRAVDAQLATAREELEQESARLLAEMRREISQTQTRPTAQPASAAPTPSAAKAEPTRFSDAKRVLEEESARLREALEADRAPAAEAPTTAASAAMPSAAMPSAAAPAAPTPAAATAAPATSGGSETAQSFAGFELGGPLPEPHGLEELFPLLVDRAAKLLNTDRGSLPAEEQVKILGRALDDRDGHRAGYSERLEAWAEALAGTLGCDRATATDVRRAALLHDLGKIGVPEKILRAAARLNDRERQIVRAVPTLAEQVLRPVKGMEGVAAILGHRYEQWDGKGYPDGLKGNDIPIGARILAVIDAYGVMTTVRPYRAMVYSLDAMAELRRCAGAQFDPRVVEAFCAVLKREG